MKERASHFLKEGDLATVARMLHEQAERAARPETAELLERVALHLERAEKTRAERRAVFRIKHRNPDKSWSEITGALRNVQATQHSTA